MPRARLPIVVLGVPIAGKYNPYLVLLSREELVEYSIDVEESDTPSLRLDGEPKPSWRLEIALKSFIDVICDRLEQALRVEVTYSTSLENPPSSSLYAILSKAIVEAIAEAGGYDMTREEVIEASKSIDKDAGIDLDYVYGLREALVHGKPIVFRESEQVIELDIPKIELELVGEEDVATSIEDRLGESLLAPLTRLAGMLVVEVVNGLRSGKDWREYWDVIERVENSIYYLLYGLQPPGEKCKWSPSFQSGYGICMPGRGLGDLVELG